ncbi:MAG TPA: tripartite tricarboxylate transporter substrate binding protein [Burkholderiales bacterium]|nr:tripartite tricarboxylate transporter substrate binding protein [Burkholderiales bacterium]
MKNAVAVFATMLLAFAAAGALAQNYPVKSIRFYVGYAPGGGTDIMARAVAAKLTESLGQQVIVDNRPGANANLAADIAAKAPADGYTVLMISVSHAISKPFYKKLGYDLERDFTPLIDISIVPQFVIVHPSLPARTLKDLIALAKKQPGQITFASSGDGSPEHIAAELLKSMAKIDMIHVPYKGGSPAAIALISGEVAVGFNTAPVAIPYIKSGRVRALAVTGEKRNAALPDVPTVAESGVPGYSMNTWYGAVMPAGTPPAIVAKLNAEINRILKMPDIRERLAALGADPVGGSPEQFGSTIKSEVAKFTKVVREAHLGNR